MDTSHGRPFQPQLTTIPSLSLLPNPFVGDGSRGSHSHAHSHGGHSDGHDGHDGHNDGHNEGHNHSHNEHSHSHNDHGHNDHGHHDHSHGSGLRVPEAGSGQFGSGQFGSGQFGSGQFGSGQLGSGPFGNGSGSGTAGSSGRSAAEPGPATAAFAVPARAPPARPIASSLPVLVAFPLLVIASDSALVHPENSLLARACMSSLQTLLVVSVVVFSKRLRGVSPAFVAGLWLLFAASSSLCYTSVSVVYFCLFLNAYNLSTAAFFAYDLYSAYDGSLLSTAPVLLGYPALVLSYRLVNSSWRNKTPSTLHPAAILAGLVAAAAGVAVFCMPHVDLAFLAMTLATAALVLFSVADAYLLSSANVMIIALFAFSLDRFVLRTRPFSALGVVVSVVIPALTRIDHSREFAAAPQAPARSKVLKDVMSHADTRAIFNFLLLNTAFMFVQLLYSFRSKSLGLLSDSLHMALDCASLALGLVAGTLSKNPIDPNSKYPFGLRNFETLAGFANGALLVGISGSIIFEAFGRLAAPVALQQTTELIVVSVLGLLVNIVGIFAFNHGHGHSHGHSHSHATSHSHSHSHSTAHTEEEDDCGEMNDNMRGIFLHILADTLGSVGVVISTILTKLFHWQGFDPVASIIIAVLIFMTAVPLMKSTASALLLKLDSKKESTVRNALNDLTTIKGVKSFTTPRFWATDNRLGGLIHIQIYRGENGAHLKKQCESVFISHRIDVLIQIENDYDSCWCRA